MEPWVSRSRPVLQLAVAVGATGVGAMLIVALRDSRAAGSNASAGFLLGVLLLCVGVLAPIFSGSQAVVVDPRMRRIRVVDSYLFGQRERVIAFDDVRRVSIGFVGKASNYVTMHYLVLHLRDGCEYPLFAAGRFYEGSSDREVVEGWRTRLQNYLGTGGTRVDQRHPADDAPCSL